MNGSKCVAVLSHPSLQQHVREDAEKPFAFKRLEQRGHGSQERNVVRATSERAQQSSPVLKGPQLCIQPHHHLSYLPSLLELGQAQNSHCLTTGERDRQPSITQFCKESFRSARNPSYRHTVLAMKLECTSGSVPSSPEVAHIPLCSCNVKPKNTVQHSVLFILSRLLTGKLSHPFCSFGNTDITELKVHFVIGQGSSAQLHNTTSTNLRTSSRILKTRLGPDQDSWFWC